MANSEQILNKIARNLGQRGIAYVQSSTSVTAGNLIVSYSPAAIQSPMGGIDDSVTPFLGIGIANPGQLLLKGGAGLNTIAAIFTSSVELTVMAEAAGFANDIIIQAGDTTAQLAYVLGTADWLSMGS